MAIRVCDLKGVTPDIAATLRILGIQDTAQLLVAVEQPAGRTKLAAVLQLDAGAILELAKRADLARIQGLVGVNSELLAYAGVDSVKELSRRIPENLYAKLVLIAEQQAMHPLPRFVEVQRWVSVAKQLERAVYYEYEG